jgi:hypothetical protein
VTDATSAGAAGSAGSPVVVSVRPEPEPAVLAAIVAAVEQAWPRPRTQPGGRARRAGAVWRFSGRWWGQPVALSRQRPLIDR